MFFYKHRIGRLGVWVFDIVGILCNGFFLYQRYKTFLIQTQCFEHVDNSNTTFGAMPQYRSGFLENPQVGCSLALVAIFRLCYEMHSVCMNPSTTRMLRWMRGIFWKRQGIDAEIQICLKIQGIKAETETQPDEEDDISEDSEMNPLPDSESEDSEMNPLPDSESEGGSETWVQWIKRCIALVEGQHGCITLVALHWLHYTGYNVAVHWLHYTGIKDWVQSQRRRMLRLAGHTARPEDGRWSEAVLGWQPCMSNRRNTCAAELFDRRKELIMTRLLAMDRCTDLENSPERVLGYALYSSSDYEDNHEVILRLSEEADMPHQGEILEWGSRLECAVQLLSRARTFCVGERVQFKDEEDEDWTYGIVASKQPLSVRLGLQDEENAEQYDEVIKHPKKVKETREALSILGSLGTAAAQHASLVASCLCDSDLDVRVEASKVLKAMEAQAVDYIDQIAACLADTHSDVRKQALIVLGGFGLDASSYADVIASCLCDSNVIVRVEASKALEAIAAQAVDHIDAIVACLANTNVKVRKGALSVLSSFDQERLSSLTRSLCVLLGDVDEDVRDSAFEMLLNFRSDIAGHIAFLVKEWTVTRHRSDAIRHILEAVGRMVMNERYEIVGLHAVTYLRCLKRSLGNDTVDDIHIRFLVKSIFVELDLHVVPSLETIVNVAAFAEDALVRKQAFEILHELHSRDKSLFIEGSPGGCLGKLILSCSDFDESGSYELLDEMLALDWDCTCRWELACASLFKAQAMAQTLHPCLKSDCGSLLSHIKPVLSVAMQPPMELIDLVAIEVDGSDEPSWSGIASDCYPALPIMEVLRHDFANAINGLLTLQELGASSQTQEVVAKVLDVALNANGGCGFCVAPRSEIDALANTDGIQFTVADKRNPEYKHGYMSHRLRHVSVHDAKFLEAVQDFSCEHQVADPAYHDKYPPGHEAAGLPTDGFFIIDVEEKPGYIIKAAARIEGLPASTIVWDGVGLRHKSGLHLSWALRKAFSLVIVASASGKVTALVSDLYGVVAVRCRL